LIAPHRTHPLAERLLPGLLFALLLLSVHAPTFLHRRNFAGRDLAAFNLPMEKSIHDAYRRGRLPVWSSEISGGRPLLPNPATGALYPVRPLLSMLPFPAAMRLYPVLHWIAAGIGMLLLARTFGASSGGAWIAAVTYVFSGVGVSEVFFPNVQPGMALLPWIVWAAARPSDRPVRKSVLLSVFFALDFLASDVFTIAMAIGCCLLWIVIGGSRGERLRELAVLGGALALATLASAPQIAATALWVPDTQRAMLGMKLSESLSFVPSPLRLLELVVPYPFGATASLENWRIWGWPVFHATSIGLFTTFYAGAFALIALAASRRSHTVGDRFARALFFIALVMIVLPGLLPRTWADLPSPVPLRYPEKFAVLLVLALAVVAGLAVDRIRKATPSLRGLLAVGVFLTGLAAVAALAPHRAAAVALRVVGTPAGSPPEARADFGAAAARELPGAFAEGGLLWLATVVAVDLLWRSGRTSRGVAIALLTGVPLAANHRIARTVRPEELFSLSPFARHLHRADPAGEYRTLGESLYRPGSSVEGAMAATNPEGAGLAWIEYRQVLVRRGTVFNFDFDSGDFVRIQSLRRISAFLTRGQEARPFFGNLALRFGIRFLDQEPVAGYVPFRTSGVQAWDELAGALPDVRLAGAWREEAGPLEAANLVPRLRLGEVVLETGVRRSGRARPGRVRVVERTAERLSLVSEAPDPTWLFVLRGFWRHRTVRVDGRAVDPVPAQLAFSAVPVPAGRHTIDWRERVPGLRVSGWGPMLYLLLAAGLLVRDRRRGGSP
jgi:hypothetical protein